MNPLLARKPYLVSFGCSEKHIDHTIASILKGDDPETIINSLHREFGLEPIMARLIVNDLNGVNIKQRNEKKGGYYYGGALMLISLCLYIMVCFSLKSFASAFQNPIVFGIASICVISGVVVIGMTITATNVKSED
jgi:hypothetical protein